MSGKISSNKIVTLLSIESSVVSKLYRAEVGVSKGFEIPVKLGISPVRALA